MSSQMPGTFEDVLGGFGNRDEYEPDLLTSLGGVHDDVETPIDNNLILI